MSELTLSRPDLPPLVVQYEERDNNPNHLNSDEEREILHNVRHDHYLGDSDLTNARLQVGTQTYRYNSGTHALEVNSPPSSSLVAPARPTEPGPAHPTRQEEPSRREFVFSAGVFIPSVILYRPPPPTYYGFCQDGGPSSNYIASYAGCSALTYSGWFIEGGFSHIQGSAYTTVTAHVGVQTTLILPFLAYSFVGGVNASIAGRISSVSLGLFLQASFVAGQSTAGLFGGGLELDTSLNASRTGTLIRLGYLQSLYTYSMRSEARTALDEVDWGAIILMIAYRTRS